MQYLSQFKQTLMHLLHTGQLHQLVRGRSAQCVFAIQRTYAITVTAREITIRERDRELIRTRRRGRWRRIVTIAVDRGRLVLDRVSGAMQSVPGNRRPMPTTQQDSTDVPRTD